MTKIIDYLSFMGFCSVIFLGNSGLYATLQQSEDPSSMPPWIETPNGKYRIVIQEIDGELRHFVEQKYEAGIIRWETEMWNFSRVALFQKPDKNSSGRNTRGIRYYTSQKKPKELKEALEKCHDRALFIDCHPDLLLRFKAKYRHLAGIDEDYRKVVELLVEFGYSEEECLLY
jgi:hypothetical protein